MSQFVIYDPATGLITKVGACSEDDLALQGNNMLVVNGYVSDVQHFVEAGQVVSREPSGIILSKSTITANGIDSAVLSSVPSGATFEVNGVTTQVLDGSLELSAAILGTYKVSLVSPRYFPQTWSIVAE